MISKTLAGLVERLQDGDTAAADRLTSLLRPVVARAVRRVVELRSAATPLERRVHTLLAAAGSVSVPDAPNSVDWLTQAICSHTVADMRKAGHGSQAALETVLA